jgi:hypothetical protein
MGWIRHSRWKGSITRASMVRFIELGQIEKTCFPSFLCLITCMFRYVHHTWKTQTSW